MQFELDRFCNALIAIREEISAIEKGEVSKYGSNPHVAWHQPLL